MRYQNLFKFFFNGWSSIKTYFFLINSLNLIIKVISINQASNYLHSIPTGDKD